MLRRMGVKLVFMGDFNQDLTHVSSTVDFLKHELERGQSPYCISKLDETYRCASNVASLASFILSLTKKVSVHGSKLVDTGIQSALPVNGDIKYFKYRDMDAIQAMRQSANTAVIIV